MSVLAWATSLFATHHVSGSDDAKYERAMQLSDEVVAKMRERTASPDPFRSMMADIFFQHHDIALIADAFEAQQEAKIYKGLAE